MKQQKKPVQPRGRPTKSDRKDPKYRDRMAEGYSDFSQSWLLKPLRGQA